MALKNVVCSYQLILSIVLIFGFSILLFLTLPSYKSLALASSTCSSLCAYIITINLSLRLSSFYKQNNYNYCYCIIVTGIFSGFKKFSKY